jgi:hypothetical protein
MTTKNVIGETIDTIPIVRMSSPQIRDATMAPNWAIALTRRALNTVSICWSPSRTPETEMSNMLRAVPIIEIEEAVKTASVTRIKFLKKI